MPNALSRASGVVAPCAVASDDAPIMNKMKENVDVNALKRRAVILVVMVEV